MKKEAQDTPTHSLDGLVCVTDTISLSVLEKRDDMLVVESNKECIHLIAQHEDAPDCSLVELSLIEALQLAKSLNHVIAHHIRMQEQDEKRSEDMSTCL